MPRKYLRISRRCTCDTPGLWESNKQRIGQRFRNGTAEILPEQGDTPAKPNVISFMTLSFAGVLY